MADPTLLEVAKQVESKLRKIRRVDDAEELLQTTLSAYREVLRTWPWGFALQRYRTILKKAEPIQVTLTNGSQQVTLVSGNPDWSLYPSILIPRRRPLFTDGGGTLLDPWMGETGTYDATAGYHIIPLFDSQVWGVAVTNVGPLVKMSLIALEARDPNREKRGKPRAFIPYTPYVEVWPVPDDTYDVDIWMTPLPDTKIDPNLQIAAPLVDAVVYLTMSHLLAFVKPDLVPYYRAMVERAVQDARGVDNIAFSWPEFHQAYEAGATLIPTAFDFRIVKP